MKKYFFLIFLVIFLGGLAMPSVSRADQTSCENTQGTWLKFSLPVLDKNKGLGNLGTLGDYTDNGRCIRNPLVLILILYDLGLVLMAIAGVVMIMVGGYQYLTSLGGDQAKQAKTRIFYAIGGLALGLMSFILLRFVNPDLINLKWDNKELSEQLDQAVDKIRQDNLAGAALCPGDSEIECRINPATNKSKRVGDVCKKNTTTPGYCALQANVGGICTCDPDQTGCANKCTGNANNSSTSCAGKNCYIDSGNTQGRCLKKLDDTVACLNLTAACGNDCGEAYRSQFSDLVCQGMYDCTITSPDPGKIPNGLCWTKNTCMSLTDVCSKDCGGTDSDLKAKCHGKGVNLDSNKKPTAVCFDGKSYTFITTGSTCAKGMACKLQSGAYRLCEQQGGTYVCSSAVPELSP